MIDVGLDGFTLRISGLRSDLAERLVPKWGAFLDRGAPGVVIEVTARCAAATGEGAPLGARQARSSIAGEHVTFTTPEGRVGCGRSGPITIDVAATSAANQAFGFLNLLIAGLAWRLPYHDAVLLHAAGIVIDGRAFILVGGEGAGKTTWAELARSAGADVLSDDLVLVQERGSGFEAIASPFRAPVEGPVLTGRWPVAAVLGAAHAAIATLRADAPLIVRARLAANVPYAVDGLKEHDALDRVLARLQEKALHRTLAFARDPSFVPLLRGA